MSDCLCHESRFQYYCCGVLRIILFCFCCLADIVVKMKDSRFPGISDLPKQFSVTFKISSDDVSFDLTQNKDIDTDVPIYTLNHRGSVELQKMKSSEVNVCVVLVCESSEYRYVCSKYKQCINIEMLFKF